MASGTNGYVVKKPMMEELVPEIRRTFVSKGKYPPVVNSETHVFE